jgi:hypothetical protein
MAAARKDLLKKVYNMVPPMLESFHKGTLLSYNSSPAITAMLTVSQVNSAA